MDAVAPTVIVSRRPKPGREREFERWHERLVETAHHFTGHLGTEIQRPDDAHPGEWLIVYQFDSTDHLDRWLESPERRRLMLEGDDLLDGPTREQRVASAYGETEACTAVISQRVRPGQLAEFRAAEATIAAAMSRFPGFVSLSHAEPVEGVQSEYVVSITFASRADLDAWLESESRREVLSLVEPYIEGERTLNVIGGFGGWFVAEDNRPPKKWKQAAAVLLALYPTTFTLSLLQNWIAPDAQWMIALFASNVIGIAALTWVLMPPLTRVLDGWLRR